MKAILIDPTTREVREVEYNGTLENIYAHIGNSCDTFCALSIGGDGDDALFLDDDGLSKGGDCFAWLVYPSPLVGNALILGCDTEGESVAPIIDIEAVRKAVRWLSAEEAVTMSESATADLHRTAAHINAHGGNVVVMAPELGIDDSGKARA